MIERLELRNMNLNISSIFGQDLDCEFLYQDDGLDWGNVPATHNTYNYPGQIGDTISSTKINNRDISIKGYVYYILTDEERSVYGRDERDAYAYNKIKSKKKKLNDLINPNHTIRITVGNYYIEGKPSASPQYGVGYEENNIYFCSFLINIFCANPMFKKVTESKTILSGDTGTFHFPFIIQDDMNYIMGIRTNYLIIVVENEGNATIGGQIHLTAKGEVKNPKIENVITGEYIRINKTLQAGEQVIIDTTDGPNKGVSGIYQGVYRDYLQYWDFTNTYIKFDAGSVILGYSTENDSELLLDVVVDINPEKFGLEDM